MLLTWPRCWNGHGNRSIVWRFPTARRRIGRTRPCSSVDRALASEAESASSILARGTCSNGSASRVPGDVPPVRPEEPVGITRHVGGRSGDRRGTQPGRGQTDRYVHDRARIRRCRAHFRGVRRHVHGCRGRTAQLERVTSNIDASRRMAAGWSPDLRCSSALAPCVASDGSAYERSAQRIGEPAERVRWNMWEVPRDRWCARVEVNVPTVRALPVRVA